MPNRNQALGILFACVILTLFLFGYHSFHALNYAGTENDLKTGINDEVTINTYQSDKKLRSTSYKLSPHRIIAVYQNSAEALMALGVSSDIVAVINVDERLIRPDLVHDFDNIPMHFDHGISREKALMCEPDLIVGWYSTFMPKRLGNTDWWESREINTYIAPSSFGHLNERQKLEDEYKFIEDLGKILNKQDKAEELIRQMNHEIEKVASISKQRENKPRAIIVEFEGNAFRSYGRNTLAGNILEHLGIPLAFEGNHLSYEEFVTVNPDLIFVVNLEETESGGEKVVKRMMEMSGFNSVNAVKHNRVYQVPLYEMYCSGIRSYDGIKRFAKGAYPDLI